jgi:hypothetical protein
VKQFAFKLSAGYLIGSERPGAPCAECARRWLDQRKVAAEPIPLETMLLRRELLEELAVKSDPGVFYEVDKDGAATKLECFREPHPECGCGATEYAPEGIEPGRLNLAFTAGHQIKSARYTCPTGNVWLTEVAFPNGSVRTAVATERAVSRWNAFKGPTGDAIKIARHVNGVVTKYSEAGKPPMLIVGTSNWVRNRLPFFILQQFDLHLLFYPNAASVWVVGVVAMSRVRKGEVHWSFGGGLNIVDALDQALLKTVELARPAEWGNEAYPTAPEDGRARRLAEKRETWLTHWIYRAPKIVLKDVLHLDPYVKLEDAELKSADRPRTFSFRAIEGGKQ